MQWMKDFSNNYPAEGYYHSTRSPTVNLFEFSKLDYFEMLLWGVRKEERKYKERARDRGVRFLSLLFVFVLFF